MIVVDRRGERQHRRHLDGEARFSIGPPKLARAGLIHHEEQGDLALLVEGLHEGMPHPRRHVPVDRAEVVPLLVLAHFGELDALAAEDRAVFAGEQRVDEIPGAELDPLDLPQHLGGDGAPAGAHRGRRATPALLPLVRHGTPPASRIRAITPSASLSSASAPKGSTTPGPNTSQALAFTSSGPALARPPG